MTSVNATTFSGQQTQHPHDPMELAAGVALVSFAIFLGLVAFVIAIVIPQGFCSIRRRWIRRMKRIFGAASQTLMTEIRGEEFYAVPLEEMALDNETTRRDEPKPSSSSPPKNDEEKEAQFAVRERDMISMYKQRGIL